MRIEELLTLPIKESEYLKRGRAYRLDYSMLDVIARLNNCIAPTAMLAAHPDDAKTLRDFRKLVIYNE